MKKISIFLIIILTVNLFPYQFEVFNSNNMNASANAPPDNEGGINYGTDWNVTGQEYRGNQTIILDGNLTVEFGGSLTLYNVTLIMNCTNLIWYYIEIQTGGAIWIINGSNITSSNSIYPFMFWVRKGTNFTMKNSELHNCGWNGPNTGLTIQTKNAVLRNNTFSNNYVGVYLFEASNNTIIKCNISSNSHYGIMIGSSSNNSIIDCDLFNNYYGIVMSLSIYNIVKNCNVSFNSVVGIRILGFSNHNNIIDCDIYENSYDGVRIDGYSDFINIGNCHIINNSEYGISMAFSSFNNIENCSILYNKDKGICIYSEKTVIKNCNVSFNFGTGIHFTAQSKDNSIINCKVFRNVGDGIVIYVSTNQKINDCEIIGNICGILLSRSINSKLRDNKLKNNLDNLWIDESYIHDIDTSNTINNKPIYYLVGKEDQQISPPAGYVGIINSENITINDLVINNGSFGIYILNSRHIIINNVTLYNDSYGIYIDTSSNIQIINSSISNCSDGILLLYSSENTIKNSYISSNTYRGIYFYSSANNNITTCNIFENGNYGIDYVYSSNYNLIRECNISNNGEGIHLFSVSKNNFLNSTISGNLYGVRGWDAKYNNFNSCKITENSNGTKLDKSDNNIITHCNFISNSFYGIDLGSYSESNNNEIYHNNFINNSAHIINSGNNTWYQEYPICGNYYDDYGEQNFEMNDDVTSLDEYRGINQDFPGKDCIGDYIYLIKTSNYDLYPLLYPYGWLPPQEIPVLKSTFNGINNTGNYSLLWDEVSNTIDYALEEALNNQFSDPSGIYSVEDIICNISNRENKTYYYRVRAENLFGNSNWSNTLKIIVDRPPNIPSGMTVSQILTGNKLKISWSENHFDTVNYTIWSNKTETWKPLVNISHPNLVYLETNLTDGIRYYYKLQAWDARGLSSGFTSTVSNISIDEVAPSPPANFTCEVISINAINLSWSPSPELDLVGYNIYRSSSLEGKYNKINTQLINSSNFHNTGLTSNTTYFYKILAYDEVPNYSNFTEIVSNTTLPVLDLTNPTILSYLPTGVDVVPYPKIKITFNELMDQESVFNSFRIIPNVIGQSRWTFDELTFVFEPDKNLAEGQTYNVTLTIGAQDLAGNPLEKQLSWNFTIGDYTAPEVISYIPNGTDVSIETVIQVVFNEELDLEYITSSAILLKDQNGSFVNGSITYDNLTLKFTPAKDLEYGWTYTALVNKLLKDEAGNELGIEHTWKFTTLEEPSKFKKGDETEPVNTTTIGIGIIILIILILVIYLILRQSGYLKPKPPPKSVSPKRSKLFDEELEE